MTLVIDHSGKVFGKKKQLSKTCKSTMRTGNAKHGFPKSNVLNYLVDVSCCFNTIGLKQPNGYIYNPLSGDSCCGEGQSGQMSVVGLCPQTCNSALLRKVSTFSKGCCCGARVSSGLGPQNG